MKKNCLIVVIAALLMVLVSSTYAASSDASELVTSTDLSLILSGDTEISIQRYPSKGQSLVIWLMPASGIDPVYRRFASQLVIEGVEVWLVDLIEAHFLPGTRSSLYKLPASDVASLIASASKKTGKAVYLAGEGAGAIPLLRGANKWQSENTGVDTLKGAIFNSPDFYVGTPNPGESPRIMPVVARTSLPVFIIQPEQSPRYWQLGDTVPVLEAAGSSVFVRILRDVRGRFHRRLDAVLKEKVIIKQMPSIVRQSMVLLDTVPRRQERVVPLAGNLLDVPVNKKDRTLVAWRGDPVPPPLNLEKLGGGKINLTSLKGQVVLVNFWTTWCPPCVHEMPSLQLLQEAFERDRFLVLGVDMAEEAATIREFLRTKVSVDFPILLDRNGEILKQWQVHAFPTSFVIGKNNRIRYALFGSIQWDAPEIINKIRKLTEESLNQ